MLAFDMDFTFLGFLQQIPKRFYHINSRDLRDTFLLFSFFLFFLSILNDDPDEI